MSLSHLYLKTTNSFPVWSMYEVSAGCTLDIVPWTSASYSNDDASCVENLLLQTFSYLSHIRSFSDHLLCISYIVASKCVRYKARQSAKSLLTHSWEGRPKWPSCTGENGNLALCDHIYMSQFCSRITPLLYANLIGWNQYLSRFELQKSRLHILSDVINHDTPKNGS